MSTALFQMGYLAENQAQKEVQINVDLDIIDTALGGYLLKSVAGAVDVTLSATEWRYRMLAFTGEILANINVIVPVTSRFFVAYNNTTGAFSLTVKTASGTGIEVLQGERLLLACDGTNVVSIAGSGGGGGVTYAEVTGTTQAMDSRSGYIANNAALVTLTLPGSAELGEVIEVSGKGAGGWAIAQNASQQIHFGSVSTTIGTGGSLSSTQRYDSVALRCITENLEWVVLGAQGLLTVV